MTGIKAHTWRSLEQRNPGLMPKRPAGKHRAYSIYELSQLLQITLLMHNGWKASKIVKLSLEQIGEEVKNIHLEKHNFQTSLWLLLLAAINFNEKEFDRLLDQVINTVGFEQCITSICYPFLQKIGLLGTTSKVALAQEHFSILKIQNTIIAETEKLDKQIQPPNLVLFSPLGSSNELALLYINYLFRKEGWSVVYLGSNVPAGILQQFSGNPDIRYLFLQMNANIHYFDADLYLEGLCRTFASKKIIATGSFVQEVQRIFTNLTLLRSDKEILEFILHSA